MATVLLDAPGLAALLLARLCNAKPSGQGQASHFTGGAGASLLGAPRWTFLNCKSSSPRPPPCRIFFFSPSACGVGGVGEWGRGGAGASEGTHPLASRKLRVGTPCCHIAKWLWLHLLGSKKLLWLMQQKQGKSDANPHGLGGGNIAKYRANP